MNRTATMRHSVLKLLCLLSTLAQPDGAAPTFTQILGQPTDRSATVNVRSDTAVEFFFEYGSVSGKYSEQTKRVTAAADTNAAKFFLGQAVISGLVPDALYYYRMQYRASGTTDNFTPGAEYSFHTQRLPGSSFVFCVQGDSHPERANNMFNANLYVQTLTAVAKERPDFFITSGDDFSVDTLQTPYTSPAVTGRYTLQLPYFDIFGRSAALFLGTGNHEETSLSNLNLPPDKDNSNQVPIWAQNARNLYYAMPGPSDPITGNFYTGNSTTIPGIGLLRDYYAFQWGDALFVVIDPYWTSPAQVDTGLGGQNSTTPKATNKWDITHGDAQYQWLKQTLEQSTAKWKFVFAHHVMGTGRGGVEIANQFEWGGNNGNGSYGFTTQRPSWTTPIHQLFVDNHVTIFFQGHDHIYCHQQLDGVTYQSLPNPADNTYTAFNSDAYLTGEQFPNAGYVKLSVGPESVKVDYIREFLPADENAQQVSGMNQFSYTITPSGTLINSNPTQPAQTPTIASVFNAASGVTTIAPNTWISIKGTHLAPQGGVRGWASSDFLKNQLPTSLDGVSVTIDKIPAYISYISPTQINLLTPPGALKASVNVAVTVNGKTSTTFSAKTGTESEALFVVNGGPYVAGQHGDGSPISASSPAKPGDVVVLYGTGFGSTSTPVVAGSPSQGGTLSPQPVFTMGGTPAAVQFAGLVGPGLFQFNVVVPANTSDGDETISARYAGATTQAGTLIPVQQK